MSAYHEWAEFGHILVTFSTAGEISDTDWDGFMKDLDRTAITKYLGVSVGVVHANSVKRKQGSEILTRRKISSAIVTDETLVRGLVTAVSWLGVDMKAFAWTDLGRAIHYLDGARYESLILQFINEQKRACKAA